MASTESALRSTQVLKQEAEDIGLTGKEVAEYVREQQTLVREERTAWRNAQKRQVEFWMAELQAEDQKRADEIHMAERADEIKVQIAQIEAAKDQAKIDKELKIKEIELQAEQAQAQATTSSASAPPLGIKMPSPRSYHPL